MAAILVGSEILLRGKEARSSNRWDRLSGSIGNHAPGCALLWREALCDKTPLLKAGLFMAGG
jgi:hypothetical protein